MENDKQDVKNTTLCINTFIFRSILICNKKDRVPQIKKQQHYCCMAYIWKPGAGYSKPN